MGSGTGARRRTSARIVSSPLPAQPAVKPLTTRPTFEHDLRSKYVIFRDSWVQVSEGVVLRKANHGPKEPAECTIAIFVDMEASASIGIGQFAALTGAAPPHASEHEWHPDLHSAVDEGRATVERKIKDGYVVVSRPSQRFAVSEILDVLVAMVPENHSHPIEVPADELKQLGF